MHLFEGCQLKFGKLYKQDMFLNLKFVPSREIYIVYSCFSGKFVLAIEKYKGI